MYLPCISISSNAELKDFHESLNLRIALFALRNCQILSGITIVSISEKWLALHWQYCFRKS